MCRVWSIQICYKINLIVCWRDTSRHCRALQHLSRCYEIGIIRDEEKLKAIFASGARQMGKNALILWKIRRNQSLPYLGGTTTDVRQGKTFRQRVSAGWNLTASNGAPTVLDE